VYSLGRPNNWSLDMNYEALRRVSSVFTWHNLQATLDVSLRGGFPSNVPIYDLVLSNTLIS
jgi:hypothetical protein